MQPGFFAKPLSRWAELVESQEELGHGCPAALMMKFLTKILKGLCASTSVTVPL